MRILGIFALTLGLAACSTYQTVEIEQPQSTDVVIEAGAMAGAVSVDITPPPGMPKGGYSILGNSGIGFRTRLKARIFYLNDGRGQSMALIQTDLAGSSLLVHHKVAALVAEKTGLKAGDIVVTGTHSHSSVANHFHNDFYNKHFSHQQGLETEFLESLSQRIADGVIQAHKQRRLAKVATGRKNIYGYNRNRMMNAYVLNQGKENVDLDDPNSKFKEVNPALYMVRIDVKDDDGQYKPLGAFSSFSVHGTTITPQVKVYNADVFGYAQRELEWSIKEKYNTSWNVLHGLTTGTQGDMAPALVLEDNYITNNNLDFVASRKLGLGIGKEAIGLFESLGDQLSSDLTLATAAREIDIRVNNKAEEFEICEQPLVGNTTAGGALERRSPWLSLVPLLRGGGWGSSRWWFGKDGCHGSKRILGTSLLQPLLEPTDSFPSKVLFQIMRINDMLIMPLPFEITTESGRRISERVKAEFVQAGNDIKHSWVTSVANGYFGYSTTPEEYEYQSYEGGSTLYGRYSTPYIAAQLGILAKDFNRDGEVEEMLSEWSYYLKTTHLLPEKILAVGKREVLTKPELVTTDKKYEEDYMYFRWLDVNPSQINFHKPLVHIEVELGGIWSPLKVGNQMINDEGYNMEVRFLDDEDKGMGEYEARWYAPEKNGAYRFVIAERDQQTRLYSDAFNF